MPLTLPEVPHNISAYFDDDNPLGPVAAEYISNKEVAAYLLSLENESYMELFQGAAVLFGRKGAGKSSVLNSFLFPSTIKSHMALALDHLPAPKTLRAATDLQKSYAIIVKIDAAREISKVYGEVKQEGLRLPELAAEAWNKRLWLNVVRTVSMRPYLLEDLDPPLRISLVKISSLLQRLSDADSEGSYFENWLDMGELPIKNVDLLVAQLRSAFRDKGYRVLFLVDTMEEYDLTFDDALRTTVGGLLYLAGRKDPAAAYKLAFPYEIYDAVRLEGNPEKYALQATVLRWKPSELVRIVTRRMLLCLYLFENEELERILNSNKFSSDSRKASFDFWTTIFGGEIQNEVLQYEPPLYFVLRHTQLLPRQLINGLSRLVKLSKIKLRSFLHIDPEVLYDSMKISSNDLIGGLESGFKFTYPGIGGVFESFLTRCDILTTYNDLHKVYSNSSVNRGQEYTQSFDAFMRALLHVGVFGVVTGQESDKYIEAAFCYGDDTILRSFQGRAFAMHPAFSLMYKHPEDRLNVAKAILPVGSMEGLE